MNIFTRSLFTGMTGAVLVYFILSRTNLTGSIPFLDEGEQVSWTGQYSLRMEGSQADIQHSIASIGIRLKEAGLNYKAAKKPDGTIRFDVFNLPDTGFLVNIFFNQASISFHELYSLQELNSAIQAMDRALASWNAKRPSSANLSLEMLYGPRINKVYDLLQYPQMPELLATEPWLGFIATKDTAFFDSLTSFPTVKAALPADLRLLYGYQKDAEEMLALYAIRVPPEDQVLDHRAVRFCELVSGPSGSEPMIGINFYIYGTSIFRELTSRNLGKCIAITQGDRVISAPTVDGIISNGQCNIGGPFTRAECLQLISGIRAGPLPVAVTIMDSSFLQNRQDELMNPGKALLLSGLSLIVFTACSFLLFRALKPLKTR
jgi:hypothetical protein